MHQFENETQEVCCGNVFFSLLEDKINSDYKVLILARSETFLTNRNHITTNECIGHPLYSLIKAKKWQENIAFLI